MWPLPVNSRNRCVETNVGFAACAAARRTNPIGQLPARRNRRRPERLSLNERMSGGLTAQSAGDPTDEMVRLRE